MTALQLAEKFSYSESYIKTHWKQAQQSLWKKHNVKVERQGRGKNADYIIIENNNRAVTLYKEPNSPKSLVSKKALKMMDMDLLVLVTILTTPYQVWRGSYTQFLKYIEVTVNSDNREALKKSLNYLYEKDFIHYAIDKTDSNYFFAGIYRKVEQEMKVSIDMMKECKRIAEVCNRRKWIPMFKIWMTIQYIVDNDYQPFTTYQIADITGLPLRSIWKYMRDLQKEGAFLSQKVYGAIDKCLGQEAELNIFYEYINDDFIEAESL